MMIQFIKSVYAATVDLGPIQGVGVYQTNVGNKTTTGILTGEFISNIITTISVVSSLAFVIYFTMAGLKWIIAGGDKAKVQEAQNEMVQAAIGLIAVVASYFIAGIIGGILGIDILNPFKVLF